MKGDIAAEAQKPLDRQQVLRAARHRPLRERLLLEMFGLEGEKARHELGDARIIGGVVVLDECLQGDHPRPPVAVRPRSELAVRALALQYCLDPALNLVDQIAALRDERESGQAIEVVRPALPVLAVATQPGTTGSNVAPRFLEPAGQAVGLQLELAREPA